MSDDIIEAIERYVQFDKGSKITSEQVRSWITLALAFRDFLQTEKGMIASILFSVTNAFIPFAEDDGETNPMILKMRTYSLTSSGVETISESRGSATVRVLYGWGAEGAMKVVIDPSFPIPMPPRPIHFFELAKIVLQNNLSKEEVFAKLEREIASLVSKAPVTAEV